MNSRSFTILSASPATETGITSERKAIARMSELTNLHWLAVFMSLLLTIGAWYLTSVQVAVQAQNRFDRYSEQVVELVQERMSNYEDALLGGLAAIKASGGDMTLGQWREFTRTLHIETKYPGINGLGVIYRIPRTGLEAFLAEQRRFRPDFDVHPGHSGNVLYPITYIEPEDINAAAVGLDMAHETNRLSATLRSRDTAKPQITAPIILVQDAQKSPGFLFFMPFFEDRNGASLAGRQEGFIGMVYAPFVFRKLIMGVLGQENRLVNFAVSDDGTMLYDEKNRRDTGHAPEFTKTADVEFYGRTWRFDIWSTSEFEASSRSNEPIVILIGGLIIDTLLFTLFFLLTRSNRRALGFADRMAEKALTRANALERSNEDLERFAYVASHDLKTPLRGIGFLAQCIREDMCEINAISEEAELFENLGLLEDQVKRLDHLISGILTYSRIQTDFPSVDFIDTARFIPSVCNIAGLQPDQYKVTGDLVEFETDAIRLEQVLQNLIGNAVKYHHGDDRLEVTIHVADTGDRLRFTVADNGPGIDPSFHKKIFEMFQTLQAGKAADSTGIGLAIVQKIVTLYGGKIILDSTPGEGSRFTFDWPRTLNLAEAGKEAA